MAKRRTIIRGVEYHAWATMKQRCLNKRNPRYHYYGGRGINVCDEWNSYSRFLADMGHKPPGLTLERRDNNLGYSPDNCYWAPRVTQVRNRRVQKNNTTGFRGVSRYHDRYIARISVRGTRIFLGVFDTIADAAEARRIGETKYWTTDRGK